MNFDYRMYCQLVSLVWFDFIIIITTIFEAGIDFNSPLHTNSTVKLFSPDDPIMCISP